jgi:hypothetical protein
MGQTFTITKPPAASQSGSSSNNPKEFEKSYSEWRDKVTIQLQARQTLVSALNAAQFLCTAYLVMQSLVTGYAIVNPNGGTAIPHLVFILGPWLSVFTIAMFTRFEIGLYMDALIVGMYYAIVMCVVSIVVSGVGLGFFAWELAQGRSDFYVLSFGFLVATVIITALFIVIDFLLIAAISVFLRDLKLAQKYDWRPHFHLNTPMYEKDPLAIPEETSFVPRKNEDPYPTPQTVLASYQNAPINNDAFALRRTKLVKNN